MVVHRVLCRFRRWLMRPGGEFEVIALVGACSGIVSGCGLLL